LTWVFVAARRDHFPAADIRGYNNDVGRPIGYYMNFQFTSTGAHLAQAEGPWKMEMNYKMVNSISKRPLELSVVNAGNIREFVMELSANALMMWDFDSYQTDVFLEEFSDEYFGSSTTCVAKVYRDFYNSYWTQKKPDIPDFDRQYLFQDERYARAHEQLLPAIPKGRNLNPLSDHGMDVNGNYFRIVPEDNGASNQIQAILNGVANSITKLTTVVAEGDACLAVLSVQGRAFFNDHVLVQTRFMLDLNRVFNSTASAMNVMPDRAQALAQLKDAQHFAAAMQNDLHEAEHGRFTGWYSGDKLFGVTHLRDLINTTIQALEAGY